MKAIKKWFKKHEFTILVVLFSVALIALDVYVMLF